MTLVDEVLDRGILVVLHWVVFCTWQEVVQGTLSYMPA